MENQKIQRPLMTIKEVAEYLQVSVRTVQRILDSGELPYRKIKGSIRIKMEDLDKYVEKCSRTKTEKGGVE